MPGSPPKFISYCSRESMSFGPSQDECVGLSGKSTLTFQSHEASESLPLLETKRTQAFLSCRQWTIFGPRFSQPARHTALPHSWVCSIQCRISASWTQIHKFDLIQFDPPSIIISVP